MWPTEAGSIGRYGSRAKLPAVVPSHSRFFAVPRVRAFASGFDALRVYGSGAASDGGAQADSALNLGGYRSSTELQPFAIFGGMLNVVIERASGGLLTGVGILESDGAARLRWTSPGSSAPGPWTLVGSRPVVVGDGVDGLRVRVSGDFPPAGSQSIRILDQFNNAFGQDDASDAERIAGASQYRAFFLKNEGILPLVLRLYLQRLGSARQLQATYAASGAISIAPAANVKNWQPSGFFENQDTGEVLYYSSRTDSELTIPAAGRDVFGEVAGGVAGSIGDAIHPIPGQRIAAETPVAREIQTIADESTAPTGLTWKHGVETDDADTIEETLLSGELLGVWVQRLVSAGASARAQVPVDIVIETQR